MNEILFLEELQSNAFPALQTVMYDGRSVRFGGGFTYRVNCANPMYPESLPLQEKLDYVENLYRNSGLSKSVFKLHEGMDLNVMLSCEQKLTKMGYGTERVGNVFLCDLGAFDNSPRWRFGWSPS